jgi:hypothetical protein
MTKYEAAVIMAYTGVCTLVGNDLDYYYKYVCGLLGEAIWTHELPEYFDLIREKSKPDFMEIMQHLTEPTVIRRGCLTKSEKEILRKAVEKEEFQAEEETEKE